MTGARLATRPAWPIRYLADRLAAEHQRLDELDSHEAGVRASFAVSIRQLPSNRAADLFCLIGLPDGPDICAAAAGRLLEQPGRATERILHGLVDAHLLDEPIPGRYHMRDLLRLYARERADTQLTHAERVAAMRRLLDWYQATARQANELLYSERTPVPVPLDQPNGFTFGTPAMAKA